jgi:hypothetical protein
MTTILDLATIVWAHALVSEKHRDHRWKMIVVTYPIVLDT